MDAHGEMSTQLWDLGSGAGNRQQWRCRQGGFDVSLLGLCEKVR